MTKNELQQVWSIESRTSPIIFGFSIEDESGSDSEEESPNSCFSSLNDFISEMRNSGICGEIRGKIHLPIKMKYSIWFLENQLYPENQERTACVEYSTVYHPPEVLQIPENSNLIGSNASMSESTLTSSSFSDIPSRFHPSDRSGLLPEIDSRSSSATIIASKNAFK